ncbi:MAG: DUF523 and DUF1722 domain-containing protein [Planctomycetes bacterium]|nr:DUF523 and DUF1722 domain-containing protein [Planctomycetota bacterium]
MVAEPLPSLSAQDWPKLRLGVSACLMGEEVRFDGGHQKDRFLLGPLAEFATYSKVCPEVEAGLGTPRPTARLQRSESGPRFIIPSSGEDLTDLMEGFSRDRAESIGVDQLDGFILKRSSPSCGISRVKLYTKSGSNKDGVGVFAAALKQQDPLLPMEEDGRLNDIGIREHFLTRAFCRARWRAFTSRSRRPGELVQFHQVHKLLLQTYDDQKYRALGHIVADLKSRPLAESIAEYGELFQRTLKERPSRGRNVNALQHLAGYLKTELSGPARRRLNATILSYQRGDMPIEVPLELLRYHFDVLHCEYPRDQIFLEPYPIELATRWSG